jgi:hypothetical protein
MYKVCLTVYSYDFNVCLMVITCSALLRKSLLQVARIYLQAAHLCTELFFLTIAFDKSQFAKRYLYRGKKDTLIVASK